MHPLRVLWVLSALERDWRGGIGRVASAMAREFRDRRHEVHLAGRARDGAPGAIDGITLHPLPPATSRLGRIARVDRLVHRLRPDVVHFH